MKQHKADIHGGQYQIVRDLHRIRGLGLSILRGQTDRNIRKVRDTVLRKIHKKMAQQLLAMPEHGYIPSEREQRFLHELDLKEGQNEEEASE